MTQFQYLQSLILITITLSSARSEMFESTIPKPAEFKNAFLKWSIKEQMQIWLHLHWMIDIERFLLETHMDLFEFTISRMEFLLNMLITSFRKKRKNQKMRIKRLLKTKLTILISQKRFLIWNSYRLTHLILEMLKCLWQHLGTLLCRCMMKVSLIQDF